jgi:hypothetical protein
MSKKNISENLDAGDDEPVGDPTSLVVLKAAVYIMGVMIILGVGILVYTLISRASKLEPGISAVDEIAQLVVTPGEKVRSVSLNRGSLAIHLETADGKDSIVIYSLSRQKIMRRIEVTAQ